MSKPTPAHHKTVRVPFLLVQHGYDGVRRFRGLDGEWTIVSATTVANLSPHPCPSGMIHLIVAPARVTK